MCSITLHNTEIRAFDFFISGKAIFALQTFAAAADARTIPRLTGIDDLVITRPALGATHSVEAFNNTQGIVSSILSKAKFSYSLLPKRGTLTQPRTRTTRFGMENRRPNSVP